MCYKPQGRWFRSVPFRLYTCDLTYCRVGYQKIQCFGYWQWTWSPAAVDQSLLESSRTTGRVGPGVYNMHYWYYYHRPAFEFCTCNARIKSCPCAASTSESVLWYHEYMYFPRIRMLKSTYRAIVCNYNSPCPHIVLGESVNIMLEKIYVSCQVQLIVEIKKKKVGEQY